LDCIAYEKYTDMDTCGLGEFHCVAKRIVGSFAAIGTVIDDE
jgi:hypothetical protein